MPIAIAPDDPRLLELLDRWFALRDEGRAVELADLTDDPDLRLALAGVLADIDAVDAALGGPPAPAEPALGVRGRYRIEGPPAVGGMGEVYPARDLAMNGRVVAYKVMKPGRHGSPWLVAQFYREAVITDEVRQPGVVPIYAKVDDDSGRPAYVMEFVRGTNLHEAIEQRRGEPAGDEPHATGLDLLRRFLDACRIVGVAHAKGFVHADLNLGNIMLVEQRRATRVVDWGSALKVGTGDELRRGHAVAPDYRDPALGVGEPPGFTSDVFALGVGLHQLAEALIAAGAPLVEGRKPAGAARALRSIALRAAAHRPEERYPTASALADDLQRFLDGQPVRADRGEPLAERCWRWVARHRTGVAATIALALVTTASLATLTYTISRAAVRAQEARQAREVSLGSEVARLMLTCQLIHSQGPIDPPSDLDEAARLIRLIAEARGDELESVKTLVQGLADEQERHRKSADTQAAERRTAIERNLNRSIELLETLVRDYPERERGYRLHLATTSLALGRILLSRGPVDWQKEIEPSITRFLGGGALDDAYRTDRELALATFEKALRVLPAVTPSAPSDDQARVVRSELRQLRFVALLLLARFTEALQALDGMGDVASGPGSPALEALRPIVLKAAEMEQARMPWSRPERPEHAQAARMAEYLAAQPGVSDPAIFNAACALALASQDAGGTAAERSARADRAMACLRRIAARGYFRHLVLFPLPPRDSIRELRTDPALDPLRERADFRELVDRFP